MTDDKPPSSFDAIVDLSERVRDVPPFDDPDFPGATGEVTLAGRWSAGTANDCRFTPCR